MRKNGASLLPVRLAVCAFCALSAPGALVACGGNAPPPAQAPPPSAVEAPRAPPPPPPASAPVIPAQIAAGDYHTCARMTDETVRCWGRNREGQLGDGTTFDKDAPLTVPHLTGVESITLGANSTCALTRAKNVFCWGFGDLLGTGKSVTYPEPTRVPWLSDVDEIDAGGLMICARLSSGAVHCWGAEPAHSGSGAAERTAILSGAVQISVAETHACARMADGSVKCWGDGLWNDGAGLASPVLPHPATQLTTGDSVACAFAFGGISCWGRNEQGELGVHPDMGLHVKPVQVDGIGSATAVVAGEAHLCALLDDGSARCWGSNGDGELGRGTRTGSERPAPVRDIAGVVEMALGADHACARTSSDVFCWGSNGNGQLGDGTHDRHLTPVRVSF